MKSSLNSKSNPLVDDPSSSISHVATTSRGGAATGGRSAHEGAVQDIIRVESLEKSYGSGPARFNALSALNLSIYAGEFFTLLGPSGCGKTTLLRMIAGFDFPTDGEIRLEGVDIAHLPPSRRPVNTVFQNYALFPHLSVAQNIAFGLEMLRLPRKEIDERVEEMLRVVRLEPLRDRKPAQISGGQQQRVALARALAPHPKVLLLDEPLSALDFKLRKEMQLELKRLQHETGITFVFVTHDQEEALTMSDRIAVMSQGRIAQIGSAQEIYDEPSDRFVADFIGEANFLQGRIASVGSEYARMELAEGVLVEATLPRDGVPTAAAGAVMVRPEHAYFTNIVDANLTGTVSNSVYFGTGTNYFVDLDIGGQFVIRQQSKAHAGPVVGDRVGIAVRPDKARVLVD